MTILTQLLQTQTNKEKTINYNFNAVSPAALFAWKNPEETGLRFKMYGGYFYLNDGSHSLLTDSSNSLTASTINYVERNLTGAVSINTTGFTQGNYACAKITTDAANITVAEDFRIFIQKKFGKSLHVATIASISANQKYFSNHAIRTSLNISELLVEARLYCKNANNGYSVNDEVVLSPAQATVCLDSSYVTVQFGSSLNLLAKSTGTPFSINFSDWGLKIKVIRYAHS